ncbi:MAG: hypothetical protein JNM30_04015 [Rhodospirillales bacterium]|nr:hypothetical protein [Rhodospirillales bacterium]
MARDGSWSTGSWKASPWRDGPRRRKADSDEASASTANNRTANVLAGPAVANVLAGPAGGARLADLREWHIVEARCARCRHVGRLRPKQLAAFVARRPSTRGGRQLAGQTRLAEILERFACSECGNRAGNEIAVVAVERNV